MSNRTTHKSITAKPIKYFEIKFISCLVSLSFSLSLSLQPRPYAQQYQVKESSTNKPKPLSDEFSNEFTASGESYNGNNR